MRPATRLLISQQLAAGLLAFALCGAASAQASNTCEFQAATLRVIHPWTRATLVGAKDGVLLMTFQDVAEDDRLIAIETPIASGAELIRSNGEAQALNLPIPKGQVTTLSEEGMHIRLLGLKHKLEVGRSYPLTMVFAKGGTVVGDVDVDYEALPPPACPQGNTCR